MKRRKREPIAEPDGQPEAAGPALESTGRRPVIRMGFLLPLLLAILVVGLCYRSPWSASELEVVPDSGEYAIGAQRLVLTGHYTIAINGVAYPPRYPPWYPLILAPLYAAGPYILGIGILASLGFAIVAALAAFAIGRRLAGDWGGCLAAMGLVSCLMFGDCARQIGIDVPATALGLIVCVLYLRLNERSAWRDYLLAGAAAALATGFRTVFAALTLPLIVLALRSRPRSIRYLVLCIMPLAAVTAATLAYNQQAFGDWRRNGYQYWCSVPYDYPGLTMSAKYVLGNLRDIATLDTLVSLGIAALGISLMWKRRDATLIAALRFTLLTAAPISLFHLFYFAPGLRFHLLTLSLLRIIGAAGVATRIPLWARNPAWLMAPVAGLAAFVGFAFRTEPVPERAALAAQMATLPPNAVIITAINPVFLEPYVVRGTQRRILPESRIVEYASKCVTPRRVPDLDPPARSALDHRAVGLRKGGAFDPIPFTADEAKDQIVQWVRSGVPVYLDESRLSGGTRTWSRIREQFEIVADTQYRWFGRLVRPR